MKVRIVPGFSSWPQFKLRRYERPSENHFVRRTARFGFPRARASALTYKIPDDRFWIASRGFQAEYFAGVFEFEAAQ
jgi:hypothetical protein